MSIPKKGSRQVVVDKVEFRWRVRSRLTYDQALAVSPLILAVELSESRGSVLTVDLPQAHQQLDAEASTRSDAGCCSRLYSPSTHRRLAAIGSRSTVSFAAVEDLRLYDAA